AFVAIVCFFLFTSEPTPLILGFIFGLSLSLLNFRLLYLHINKAVQMVPARAKTYMISRYLIRYTLVGVCIYISLKAPYINILGTILGLLLLKIVIHLDNLFNSKRFLKGVFRKKTHK